MVRCSDGHRLDGWLVKTDWVANAAFVDQMHYLVELSYIVDNKWCSGFKLEYRKFQHLRDFHFSLDPNLNFVSLWR